MEIEIENVEDFKNGINAVNELIDEGKLRFTKDKFYIEETDSANIAMIHFNLGKENFKNYKIKKDIEVWISFTQFNQILKRIKSNSIILDIKENSIEIILKDKNTKKFVIPILELEDKKIQSFNLELKARVKIKNSIFSESILDAGIVGETLSLNINENNLKFFSQEDMNKVEIIIKKDNENISFFECIEKSNSKYSLEYLKKIEKGSKISNVVKLEFGEDYPLRVSYENKDVSIIYVLAPRVDNDY